MKLNFLWVLILFTITNLYAQLDLKTIMKGQDFIGYWPEYPFWSADGNKVLFSWRDPNTITPTPQNIQFEYDIKSKKVQALDPNTFIPYYDPKQQNHPNQFYQHNNQIWSYDKVSKQHRKVWESNLNVDEMYRSNSSDELIVLIDNQLYVIKTNGSPVFQQLTYFAYDGKKDKTEKDSSFLEKQQLELFDYLKKKQAQQDFSKKRTPKDQHRILEIGPVKPSRFEVHPNKRFVVLTFNEPRKENPTLYPAMVTKDGETQLKKARSKVSNSEPNAYWKIIDIEKDTLFTVDFNHLSGIMKRAPFTYLLDKVDTTKRREIFLHSVHFQASKNIGIADVRSADNKDRWIVLLNLETGKITELNHQNDPAWIGGPGISSWNMEEGVLGWLDETTIYFQSEESGYSHLYSLNINTLQKKALTEGSFEIHDVVLSRDKKSFYVVANKAHPGKRAWYQIDIATQKWTTLIESFGGLEVQVSPDEQLAVVRHSSILNPWELSIYDLKKKTLSQFTQSKSTQFQNTKLQIPSVINFPASDGVNIYARLYEPESNKKNGSAVLFVHGAGYLQNAHHYWSHYHREMLFHQLLAEKGYTVIDLDYRASEGYGRAYRTAIYQHMGGRDLEDFVDAKNWLVKNRNIDPNRIGIYGGSYGGFITLMGLFTKPNEFACGAALRAVTDWAHYNHEYTSNILNYPETDPEAYRKSSPIYHAEGLKNPLLILHGLVDDNVQAQDVIRLSQRLIELEKENWELMLYPVEPHGFTESSSWLDEYSRILKLFEQNLRK